jgi:hypothetical protein
MIDPAALVDNLVALSGGISGADAENPARRGAELLSTHT